MRTWVSAYQPFTLSAEKVRNPPDAAIKVTTESTANVAPT